MLIRSYRFIKTADVNSEIHGVATNKRGGERKRERERDGKEETIRRASCVPSRSGFQSFPPLSRHKCAIIDLSTSELDSWLRGTFEANSGGPVGLYYARKFNLRPGRTRDIHSDVTGLFSSLGLLGRLKNLILEFTRVIRQRGKRKREGVVIRIFTAPFRICWLSRRARYSLKFERHLCIFTRRKTSSRWSRR